MEKIIRKFKYPNEYPDARQNKKFFHTSHTPSFPAPVSSSPFCCSNMKGNTMQKNTPMDHGSNFLPGLPVGNEWNHGDQTIMKVSGITVKSSKKKSLYYFVTGLNTFSYIMSLPVFCSRARSSFSSTMARSGSSMLTPGT